MEEYKHKEKEALLKDPVESRNGSVSPEETISDRSGKKSWIPLELVIIVYFMSFMITTPVTQFYIYSQVALEYGVKDFQNKGSSSCQNSSNSSADNTTHLIQKEAADQFMYLSFVSSFPAVIPTLFLGSISDKYGRKVSMLITFSGLLLRQILYVIVFVAKLPFEILYVGNLIEGLTGYYGSALMAAFGMLADITKPGKQRAIRITVLEGVVAIMVGLTTLGMGFWIQYGGFIAPIIVASCLSFVNLIIITLFIPETNKTRSNEGSVCSIKYILRCFRFYYKDTDDKRRRIMILCFIILGLTVACVLGKSNVTTLFLLNKPLCWSVVHTQIYSAVQIVINWGIGMIILGIVQKCIKDTELIIIGTVFATGSFVLFGFANEDWLVYLYILIATLSVTVIPMLRSVMSRLSSPEEQGALFASISFMESLSTAVAGLVYSPVYKATETTFPGIMYFIMAGLMFICLLLSIPLNRWIKRGRRGAEVKVVVNVES